MFRISSPDSDLGVPGLLKFGVMAGELLEDSISSFILGFVHVVCDITFGITARKTTINSDLLSLVTILLVRHFR